MTDRLLWQALVIALSLLASVLTAALVAWQFPRKKCPECGAPMSKVPKPSRAGGAVHRCDECGYKVDAKGRKVKKSRDDDDDDDRPSRQQKKWSLAALMVLLVCGVSGTLCLVGFCVLSVAMSLIADRKGADQAGGDGPQPKIEILVRPEPEDLGPKEALTDIQGGAFDPTFKDQAPEGGLLVGMDVGLGQFMDIQVIKAIQPKYRTPQGEFAGRKFGTDFSKLVTVKAKEGYAVGALNVKAGLLVNGFSVTFMRVKGARLDVKDAYTSSWIGDKTGGNGPIVLAGDGTPIIGVIGKRNERDCNGLGLLKKR